jgi:hypothetical protein
MRDKHLDFHYAESQANQTSIETSLLNLESGDLQPLLFDLISIDDVGSVEKLSHFFERLSYGQKAELLKLVGQSGSAAMLKLIYERAEKHVDSDTLRGCVIALINDQKIGPLAFLLSGNDGEIAKRLRDECSKGEIDELLHLSVATGSMELIRMVDHFVVEYYLEKKEPPVSTYMNEEIVKATAQCPDREEYLINAWSTHGMANLPSAKISEVLMSIGATTHSIRLAQILLQHGATVDWRYPHLRGLTPLKRTARTDSAEAADFMKFLLYQGADPNFNKIIGRMKGPKNISKWLGVTWDELVQKVKEDRGKGIQWP